MPYPSTFRLGQKLHDWTVGTAPEDPVARSRRRGVFLAACSCLLGIIVLSYTVAAQDGDNQAPLSRAAAITTQRDEKARHLKLETQLKGERIVDKILENRVVKAISAAQPGWDIVLGHLITGSGIAAGPEYLRRDLAEDRMISSTWASVSIRKFWLVKTELEMPKLAGNWLFADFSATHRDYPDIDYFGPGPHSPDLETNWALQDSWLTGVMGVRPLRHTELGVIGRYLAESVGPGHTAGEPITQQAFTPEATPGLLEGSDFVQAGSFVQFDYRDNPGEAHSGGMYWLDFSDYSDLKSGRYSFDRVDAEVQQFFPILNGTHVIALHGRTTFTEAHSGDAVPFYLQPTLGGPDTLRGFDAFRFYDNNAVILNGEYRWQLYDGMNAALFMDTGKVFPRWQQISLHDLEKSYGFGLRFLNGGGRAIVRLDVGFSREGFQIWFKFGDVFGSGLRNFGNFY